MSDEKPQKRKGSAKSVPRSSTPDYSISRTQALVLLTEECAEVIHAVAKCQRFGFDHHEPGFGRNDRNLAKEIGDILGVIDVITGFIPEHAEIILHHRDRKMARYMEWAAKNKESRNGS